MKMEVLATKVRKVEITLATALTKADLEKLDGKLELIMGANSLKCTLGCYPVGLTVGVPALSGSVNTSDNFTLVVCQEVPTFPHVLPVVVIGQD